MTTIPRSQEVFLQDLRFEGDLKPTDSGDADRVHYLENLRQAVLHRLITVPGAVPLSPDYGVGLPRWRGRINSVPEQERLMRRIQEQLALDPRVKEVESLRIRPQKDDPKVTVVTVGITAVGDARIDVAVEIGDN